MTDTLFKPSLDITSFTADDVAYLRSACRYQQPIEVGGEILPLRSTPARMDLPDVLKGKVQYYTISKVGKADMPTHLVFKNFHAPNALLGHNALHGTSVYAACHAFFWVCKIWLASVGVSKDTLNQLGLSQVRLEGVDLTYLNVLNSVDDAHQQVKLFSEAAKAAGRSEVYFSAHKLNASSTYPFREAKITSYNKMEFSHCIFKDEEVKQQLQNVAVRTVRTEIKLRLQELTKSGRVLNHATAWQEAYSTGLYETLFEEYVINSMKLGVSAQRKKKPYHQAIEKSLLRLKGDNRMWAEQLLEAYFDGGDLRRLYSDKFDKRRPDNFADLKAHFAKTLNIDISVPWKQFESLGKSNVPYQIKYTQDYYPPSDLVRHCFCKDNWASIHSQLQKAYEETAKLEQPTKRTGIMATVIYSDDEDDVSEEDYDITV